MERDYPPFQDFPMNGNYQYPPPPDAALFAAGNHHHHSDAASFAGGSHHQQPNSTFWAVGNQPRFVPTVNHHQQNNDFLVAGNQISTNNPAVMNGNNVHVSPRYTDSLLESDFGRLSLVPTIPPAGFVDSSSYDVGSSSSGNRNYSMLNGDINDNGVSLSQQPQLRDIQRMRIQSAARGQVGMYMHPQINYDFESFDEFFMNPNLNEIWSYSIPNLYNNSARNLNDYNQNVNGYTQNGYNQNLNGYNQNLNGYNQNLINDYSQNLNGYNQNLINGYNQNLNGYNQPQPQSFGNGFGSSSYDLGVESLLNSSRNMNGGNLIHYNGSGNGGNFQYRSLPADRIETSAIIGGEWRNGSICRPRQRLNFTSLEDMRGKIFSLSKDQLGCRFLQEKLEKGEPEEVKMIIMEIKDHICELMVDQFGNYLVHKYLMACNQNQQLMTELILSVIKDEDTFRDICVDSHGTRSVQKLLEHLTTQEQRSVAISVLRRITVPLTKSMNGHHVIQYCLKHFSAEENKHILNEVADNCMDIALDKSGCCVLQQCVEHAVGEPRERLIAVITSNALLLSEHPYGNYVVQYIVGLRLGAAADNIMAQLSGSFVSLSMSKYGSNVVEKFLKDQPVDHQVEFIVRELLHSHTFFLRVLQDPYGNYVAQSAFRASKGAVRITMMNLIQASYANLHSHPHGKRVFSCIKGNRSRV